ncbi:MAG: V-type ATP synthase subunit D [Nitrososphaeria archaeon]
MSVGRATATKGVLQKLREQLRFTEKSKEVLKMKRDQLAAEINKLLVEIKRRKEMENMFDKAFKLAKYAYSIQGYNNVASAADAADFMQVHASLITVMGVTIPEISVAKKPDPKQIPHTALYLVGEKLTEAVEEAIELATIESKIEQIARELMETNRKVNALEKVIIPKYRELAKYVEDRLVEEDLEEFSMTKHVRDLIRERSE